MRKQVLKQQATFSTVFISIFGYLGFVVVLLYHIFDRFPKLKNSLLRLLLKLKNVLLRKGKESEYNAETAAPPSLGTDNEPPLDESSTSAENTTGQKKPPQVPQVVTVTELREPLLEWEGTVEVVSGPPIVVTKDQNKTDW